MNYLKYIINVMAVLPMLVSLSYSLPQAPVQVPQLLRQQLRPRPPPRQLPQRRRLQLQQPLLQLRQRQQQRLRPGLQKYFFVEIFSFFYINMTIFLIFVKIFIEIVHLIDSLILVTFMLVTRSLISFFF